MLVHIDETALVGEQVGIVGGEIVCVGPAAHGDDELVHLQGVLTLGVLVMDGNVFRGLYTSDARAETNLQALLGELLEGGLGATCVHRRQEGVLGLEQHDLGTQPGPDAAHLQADDAGADNAQALGTS